LPLIVFHSSPSSHTYRRAAFHGEKCLYKYKKIRRRKGIIILE
jgi:hypothetical protein